MSEQKKEGAAAEHKVEGVETLETLITPSAEAGGEGETEAQKAERIAADQKRRAEKAEDGKRIAESQVADLQAEINKLKATAMTGSKTVTEINNDLKKLADEHNVDPDFLGKLVSTVTTATREEIRAELEKDYTPKIAKIEQERNMEKANVKFKELYAKTMKTMPEYDGIVNEDVIRALAFSSGNAKKTLPEIIEETYGAAVTGKKSIENANGSRETSTGEINLNKPSAEDWDKIENDPAAKEAWAKKTQQDLQRYL